MRIVFSPAAEHDLGDIFTYIKDDLQNSMAARNIAAKILQRLQSLAEFPELGAGLGSSDARLADHRYLVVGNYLVIYTLTNVEILVLRILFGRSDYIQLLQSGRP